MAKAQGEAVEKITGADLLAICIGYVRTNGADPAHANVINAVREVVRRIEVDLEVA